MKILCCGDRHWNNIDLIAETLNEIINRLGFLPSDITIIEGDCEGADKQSKVAALRIGIPKENIKEYPANWRMYGRAAGPIRNSDMLKYNKDIELVLAFHNDIANSKGTKDMVTKARRKGIYVREIKEEKR